MDKKVGQHRKKYLFNLVDWSVQLHLNEETNYVPFVPPFFGNQSSRLTLWVRILIRARCSTLHDKICQLPATGRWFSPDPPVSTTNKTDLHDITEILLKVALYIIKQTNKQTNKQGFGVECFAWSFVNNYLHVYNVKFKIWSLWSLHKRTKLFCRKEEFEDNKKGNQNL